MSGVNFDPNQSTPPSSQPGGGPKSIKNYNYTASKLLDSPGGSSAIISSQFKKAAPTSAQSEISEISTHTVIPSIRSKFLTMVREAINLGDVSKLAKENVTVKVGFVNKDNESINRQFVSNNEELRAYLEPNRESIKNRDLIFKVQFMYQGNAIPDDIADEIGNALLPAVLRQIGMEDLIEFLINKTDKSTEEQKESHVSNPKFGKQTDVHPSDRRRIIEIDDFPGTAKPFFKPDTVQILINETRRDADRWDSLRSARKERAKIEESEILKQEQRLQAGKDDSLKLEKEKKIYTQVKNPDPEEPPINIIDNTQNTKTS